MRLVIVVALQMCKAINQCDLHVAAVSTESAWRMGMQACWLQACRLQSERQVCMSGGVACAFTDGIFPKHLGTFTGSVPARTKTL
jgi:hypothetical protein